MWHRSEENNAHPWLSTTKSLYISVGSFGNTDTFPKLELADLASRRSVRAYILINSKLERENLC